MKFPHLSKITKIVLLIVALLIVVGGVLGWAFKTGKIKPKAAVKDFYDVKPTDFAYHEIESIYWAGITAGTNCPPGAPAGSACFNPTGNVTRAQMAVFLIKAVQIEPYNKSTPTFSDVPANYWAYPYIEAIYKAGITSGCGANPLRFCPENVVTRGQMATFLTKTAGIPLINPDTPTFSDVPKTHNFYQQIETLACKEITSGCGVGTFCPTSSITRAQMAVFLDRTFLTPIQGKTKEQATDDPDPSKLQAIGNIEILDEKDHVLGVSSSSGQIGSFTTSFSLTKGTHLLRGRKADKSLVPLNAVEITLDWGWKYRGKSACGPTLNNSLVDAIRVAKPAEIKGQAIDGDSNDLIKDATVKAITKNDAGNIINQVEATADSSGNFDIKNVSPGKVTLEATRSDYTAQPSTIDAKVGQTLENQAAFLVPNANFIEGEIKTDTDEAVSAGVQIPAAASFYGYDMTFATDWQGHYKAFGVKPNTALTMTIQGTDFLQQTLNITQSENPATPRSTITKNFTFITSGDGSMIDTRPGGFITPAGQCAADTNGNVISDAYVVLSNGGTYSGGDYPEQKYYLKTDANGCITLNNIPAGIYGVVIFKDFPDGTTKYYALPGEESQITIDHAGNTDFPLNGLQEVTP